jgi:4'-phosphopantetheinyl transferase
MSHSAENITLSGQEVYHPTQNRAELAPGDVHFWTAKFSMPLAPAIAEVLCEDERQRAARFRFEEDRSFYIFAHSVLRAILSYYSGRRPEQLLFGREPGGKPFLIDGDAPASIMFNLAHSGGLVVAVIAVGRRVGVDVEQVRPFEDLLQVAESYFTSEECAFISAHAPHERERAFFRCWVKKEAFTKAEGTGLASALEPLGAVIPVAQTGCWLPKADGRDSTPWWLADLAVPDGYEGAVAVEGGYNRILHWNWNSHPFIRSANRASTF